MNASKAELLTKWYLRLNGYFTVDNFVLHNPAQFYRGKVAPHTETDVLGVRHQHSREIAGSLSIANDEILLQSGGFNTDFVIAEVKTGGQDAPNDVWKHKKKDPIAYLIRFSGLVESEDQIQNVTDELLEKGFYNHPDKLFRIRLILFFETKPNKNWKEVQFIPLEHIVDFLLVVRGQSWIHSEIGVASIHNQWDLMINQLFSIANDVTLDLNDQRTRIMDLLC